MTFCAVVAVPTKDPVNVVPVNAVPEKTLADTKPLETENNLVLGTYDTSFKNDNAVPEATTTGDAMKYCVDVIVLSTALTAAPKVAVSVPELINTVTPNPDAKVNVSCAASGVDVLEKESVQLKNILTEPGISSVKANVLAKPEAVEVEIANLSLSPAESYHMLPCLVDDAVPAFNSR